MMTPMAKLQVKHNKMVEHRDRLQKKNTDLLAELAFAKGEIEQMKQTLSTIREATELYDED